MPKRERNKMRRIQLNVAEINKIGKNTYIATIILPDGDTRPIIIDKECSKRIKITGYGTAWKRKNHYLK